MEPQIKVLGCLVYPTNVIWGAALQLVPVKQLNEAA